MPLPTLERVLFKPDEKIFTINPQKNAPELRNAARAIDLADAVLLWATREAHLPKNELSIAAVPPGTPLWICYPKPGKLETDLGRDKLFLWMTKHGFQPGRVVSVDDTWSAFSFKLA